MQNCYNELSENSDADSTENSVGEIVREMENRVFGEEIAALKARKPIPKRSSLLPVNPVLQWYFAIKLKFSKC